MRRVASLFLPFLATDRLRRLDVRIGRPPDTGSSPAPIIVAPLGDDDASTCSCPRGGGWRPGARWAQTGGAGAAMGDRETRIAAMPAHQRPAPRELGRRSEPADHPFKAMKRDEGGRGGGSVSVARPMTEAVPLVTATLDRQKMVIGAADRAALALGLTRGMALTHARALVADLDIRDGDPAADRALLGQLALFAVRRWTPTAMVDEDGDGILLDITGAAHLHGGEARMAKRMVRFCARLGLYARVAIGGTIGAAHALARHGPDRVTIVEPHGEADAMARLPVAALRIDPHQRDAARRLGLENIGDILGMPRGPVAKRLGASLLDRLDQAIGRVGEPFDALVPYEMPQSQLGFAEPIASADAIVIVIVDLVDALVTLLRERGLGARTVELVCERVDGVPQHIRVGMARGTRTASHLVRLLAMRIETIDPGFGIDTMRLAALRTEPLEARTIEGDLGADHVADVALLVDQIATRLDARAIYRASAVESDVPERSITRVGAMEKPAPWPTQWPRPVRILRRPERVDGVIALLPDQPPRRFVWRGVTHVVVRADGPERIVGEWWRRTREAYAVRDYYRVENERGERFWLFRRGDGAHSRTGDLSWWVQAIFG